MNKLFLASDFTLTIPSSAFQMFGGNPPPATILIKGMIHSFRAVSNDVLLRSSASRKKVGVVHLGVFEGG